MKIIIIRHAKVDHIWKRFYTSEQFNNDCKLYDTVPLSNDEIPDNRISDEINDVNIFYISTLPRTRETAIRLFGERKYIESDLINEVPLSASVSTGLKLPIFFWNFTGRLQWYLNNPMQAEGRRKTLRRAELFTDMLIEKDADSVVISHGFFMRVIITVMKKRGFLITDRENGYNNAGAVILIRNAN